MNSLILRVSSANVLPVTIIVSLWLLWRGHNEPGGGFVGGLVAAAGLTVYALPRGPGALKSLLRVSPATISGIGLLCGLLSGVPALFKMQPFLTSQWGELPTGLKIGTPLLFDIGVYLAVIGAILMFISNYLEPHYPEKS